MFHQIAVFSKKSSFLPCFYDLARALAHTARHCPRCFLPVLPLLVFIHELSKYEPKCKQINGTVQTEGFVYVSMCLWQKARIGH